MYVIQYRKYLQEALPKIQILDQELISYYRYSSCCCCSFCWGDVFKKA